jgi:hypothetical protein
MAAWTIYKKIGTSWVEDGTIPRPNDDMDEDTVSNIQVISLYDGSEVVIMPEVPAVKGAFVMEFAYDDGTVRAKIQAYIDNGTQVKIVTHISAVEYIGFFLGVKPKWKVGESPDLWDVQAVFKPITTA